jgi:flagellar hook-associated protein 1 FlgK
MNPENVATRNNVLEYGSTVSRSLNQLYTQIEQVRNWQDDSIQSGVDDINRLASQLANVNDQIQRTLGAGQNPNDLQDQRDAILSELANIADIQVFGSGGAGDVVTLGGHVLIQGNSALQLKTEKDPIGHLQIKWASDSSDAQISSGSLGGVLDLQQNILPDYLKSLDDIAGALITRVNEIHSTGYGTDGSTGLDFFTGTGARDIGVNSVLVADPKKVASATAAGSSGDGSIALAIANIKSEALLSGATLGDSYRTLVSKIGGDSSNASNMTDAQTSLQQQLLTQQQSISGVSIDEELTDMVRFQQAYNASARIMTVMDEMLGTIIQSMGVGGR